MKDFEKYQHDQQYRAFMKTKEDKVALALAYSAWISFWFIVISAAIGS